MGDQFGDRILAALCWASILATIDAVRTWRYERRLRALEGSRWLILLASGKEKGPLTAGEVGDFIHSGKLTKRHLVCPEQEQTWREARKFPTFDVYFASKAAKRPATAKPTFEANALSAMTAASVAVVSLVLPAIVRNPLVDALCFVGVIGGAIVAVRSLLRMAL